MNALIKTGLIDIVWQGEADEAGQINKLASILYKNPSKNIES